MPPVGIEPTIPASKQQQKTYALDQAASGAGLKYMHKITNVYVQSDVYAYMHIYISTQTPRYIHMPTYINAYMRACICLFIYIYIYIFIYTWAGIV